MDANDHVFDLIAAYALGSLSEQEMIQVQQHMAKCLACQDELRVYQGLVVELSGAVPQVSPPHALRTRLLQSIAAQKTNTPFSLTLPPRWPFFHAWRFPAWAGLGLILLLVFSNLLLWRQVSQLGEKITDTQMIVEPLYPVGEETLATGLVVMDPRGDYGTIIVDSIQPSQKGFQYQVWLGKGEFVESGGVFTIWKMGYGAKVIYAPKPLISYERVWVTIEPEGGNESPTGTVILQTQP